MKIRIASSPDIKSLFPSSLSYIACLSFECSLDVHSIYDRVFCLDEEVFSHIRGIDVPISIRTETHALCRSRRPRVFLHFLCVVPVG